METEDEKNKPEQDGRQENTNAMNDAAPASVEEAQKAANNNKPKTKTITVELPVEEHVPCISNEPTLLQMEVHVVVFFLLVYTEASFVK